MLSRGWICFLGVVFLLLAVGCGGGSGGGSGNGSGGTASGGSTGITSLMDPAQRATIIDQAQAAFDSVPVENGLRDPQKLLAALKKVNGLTRLTTAGDGCVVGTFSDNVPATFFNNDPPDSGVRTSAALPIQPNEMPSNSTVKLLDSEDPILYQWKMTDDAKMFSENGYPGTVLTLSTIEAYRAIGGSPMACLYIAGHGGPSYDPYQLKPTSYAVWTGTAANFKAGTKFNGSTYAADLLDGSLAIGFAAHDYDPVAQKDILACHYMLLPNFLVKYHWRFSKNSLVSLGCCTSGSSNAAELRSDLFNAGANTIAAWTYETKASVSYFTNSYLFDRLLGANVVNGATPPRRPFTQSDVMPVLVDMKLVTYNPIDKDPKETTWTFFRNPSISEDKAFSIFNPTLRSLLIDPTNHTLTLQGEFGSDPGKVMINSTEASGVIWGSKLISCNLPDSGVGAAGEVYVEVTPSDGGPARKSNIREISVWTGSITDDQVVDEGPKIGHAVLSVNFRADVGPVYLKPNGTLQSNTGATAWKPGVDDTILNSIKVSPGSTSKITAGGTFTDSQNDKYTYTYTGPSSYPVQAVTGGQSSFFTVILGVPSTPGLPGAFRMGAQAKDALKVQIDYSDGRKYSTTTNQIFQTFRDVGSINHGDALTEFDTQDNMNSGTESFHSGNVTETVDWTRFLCSFPPNLTRAR
ncbi:MAG TPA: hypothetical protein VG944_23675 [Fimbriimonas sp.]|nr:hypothetical protein [Fimbriimonas sp.]